MTNQIVDQHDPDEVRKRKNRERAARWRASRPGRDAIAAAKYRAKYPDRVRESRRRRYQKELEYTRQWRAANPDKVREGRARRYAADPEKGRAATARWRAANPEKKREVDARQSLRRRYGITLEDKGVMYTAQRGLCAICRAHVETLSEAHVDHCHTSGHIRGLLCSRCNLGIGHLYDDSERCLRAAAYLSGNIGNADIIRGIPYPFDTGVADG